MNSHNEWDRLQEVIVGTVDHMTVGLEFSPAKPVTPALLEKAAKISRQAIPDWYRNEVTEDLEGLAGILRSFGAEVLRPTPYASEELFGTPDWQATGKDLCNVRDLHLIVGDKVVLSPSPTRCRYREAEALRPIWQRYSGEGFTLIEAPRPRLVGDYIIPYYRVGEEEITEEDALHRKLSGGRVETYHRLTEDEILFDAAAVVRLGRDLIYLVSNTGNHRGAKWLQGALGSQYRVHITSSYRSSHIDSTILPLRPGLVLLNGARVNPGNCPEILGKWEKLYFVDAAPVPAEELDFQKNVRDRVHGELLNLGVSTDLNHMSSPWAGLNVLSLDPRTVLVQDRQVTLIKELEKHGLTVATTRMRHIHTMLGGLHCSTLDTVREGRLESYFD